VTDVDYRVEAEMGLQMSVVSSQNHDIREAIIELWDREALTRLV
jgi:hypothetical protein